MRPCVRNRRAHHTGRLPVRSTRNGVDVTLAFVEQEVLKENFIDTKVLIRTRVTVVFRHVVLKEVASDVFRPQLFGDRIVTGIGSSTF